MKIVINDCYGGFGLSMEAMQLLYKKKGLSLFMYSGLGKNLKPFTEGDSDLSRHYTNRELTEAEMVSGNIPNGVYVSDRDIERNDPDLIAVIEELGDKASDRYGDLKIVEIPDDVDWEIEEYDGSEWVAENHRTWR
jgi:hypothetical protein